ncbi:MAG: 3-dehydroquinate synthase [Spirochaeta sp.]|nr:3-dehydroquinate synthase [Spirochaeta sp.]
MNSALKFHFADFTTTVNFHGSLDFSLLQKKHTLTIFDENTFSLFGRDAPNPVILPAGEESKCWENSDKIIQSALSLGLGRDGRMVGIGGGVICDLTAFSASIYMRGCSLLLVPTTLLAMVDAAFGGKTGINVLKFKNIAGTFYPAPEVRIIIPLLSHLPAREFKSGLAEVIKTAMIGDTELFTMLQERREQVIAAKPDILEEIVSRCIRVKGRIVEQDLKEHGRRAILNLGHTFAHAMETVNDLQVWNHGEAVAWGLVMALKLGEELGMTDHSYTEAVYSMLKGYNFSLDLEAGSVLELLQAMDADKKKQRKKLRFILQRGIGDTAIVEVENKVIEDFLRREVKNAY